MLSLLALLFLINSKKLFLALFINVIASLISLSVKGTTLSLISLVAFMLGFSLLDTVTLRVTSFASSPGSGL